MGHNWYKPFTIYGYQFIVPQGLNYGKFIQGLNKLKEDLKAPFKICSILIEFYDYREYCDEDRNDTLSMFTVPVIGFNPDNSLEKTSELARELKEYIISPLFKDYIIVDGGEFYSGIEWEPEEEVEVEGVRPETNNKIRTVRKMKMKKKANMTTTE
jgi:hypothetical protein